MIGILGGYSREYLYAAAIGTLLLFGLPMFFWPLQWARVLRWRIPEHTHLAIYFGRCLASMICILAVMGFRAAADASIQPFFFDMILANCALMVVVHGYGAIRKMQPITETIEIGFWAAFFIATLCFYPSPMA